jgi:outer membrane lipopolysaccharide assembly protein LptE/RlpB
MSGCGFELRSQKSFPPQFNNVYYQADKPYSEVAISLKKELKSTGIVFADDVNNANVVFHLSDTTFDHYNTSTGPSTQARVYSLNMAITLSITDAKGKMLLAPQNIISTRDLTLQPNEIFEISTQVDVTKHSMERDLVMKIFNVLSYKKAFEALKISQPLTG